MDGTPMAEPRHLLVDQEDEYKDQRAYQRNPHYRVFSKSAPPLCGAGNPSPDNVLVVYVRRVYGTVLVRSNALGARGADYAARADCRGCRACYLPNPRYLLRLRSHHNRDLETMHDLYLATISMRALRVISDRIRAPRVSLRTWRLKLDE